MPGLFISDLRGGDQ